MSIESTILLENISLESTDSSFIYTDKQKGAGYHKYNDGTHTYVYQLSDFSGSVKLQATLELYPGETDWVDIEGTEVGGDSSIIATSVLTGNFVGKFVWIRAAYNIQDGTIVQIRFNH
jgi:hypothetical protein